jgi:trigger factor
MELNFNKIDNLNATLVVTLEKADYAPSVEKELKKQQKQAVIKGFRPGAAPMGMIKSMYAKSILAEEINRLASNGLYDYLKEQNIDIIAQPLPSETIESDIDIEKGEKFVFAFDLGLAPIFDFNISNKDSLDKYVIAVDDAEVDKEIENLGKRYGKLETVEVSEEKDVIYATATELNESNTSFEGGVNDKEISFTADLITDEAVKKQLTGVQAGTVLNLNIYSLFNENHTVIASTLGIAKEAVADLNPTFKISITEIKRQIPAELNQELFDQVMGEGVVTDIDAFRAKIKENLEAYYKNESDQQVEHMISHLLEEKHEVPLPDAFLKRWLLNTKEEQYSAENIDERYENESKVLKEILIREKAAAQYELKVEQQDIEDASLGYTLSLFRNYGMQNPDFEFVKKFSDDSLKKRDYIEQMNDIAIRRKVYNQVKEIISYNEKPVSIEEFYKLIETHNHQHQH